MAAYAWLDKLLKDLLSDNFLSVIMKGPFRFPPFVV